MKVSIVIPIYNAAKIIRRNLDLLIDECKTQEWEYEIIFCDDSSRDNSKEILQACQKEHEEVKVFFNARNVGLGLTLRHLFALTQGEIVIYLDCDLPFGAGIIKELIDGMDANSDIVVASRYMGIKSRTSLARRITSRSYYYLCRILFGITVRDIGSGSVAFRRQLLRNLQLKTARFAIHAEIFAKAKRYYFRTKEIPARMINQEKGSFSIIRHGWGIIRETYRLWYLMKT